MKEKTLVALKESIEAKWKEMRYKGGKDYGEANCPLCILFTLFSCEGCPVYEKTGRRKCYFTPYSAWLAHQRKAHRFPFLVHPGCEECKDLCDDEITFLESLLPSNLIKPNQKEISL